MVFTLLLTVGIGTSQAADSFAPVQGLYRCKKGNEESICDQIMIPKFDRTGELDAISVEYVGWCGSMGPYLYSCETLGTKTQCSDGFSDGLQFDFIDTKNYRWENKQYGFVCDRMTKIRAPR